MLAATTIGDGVARACALAGPTKGVGRVVGEFSSGFYVRAAGTLFAVGGPMIAAGPIHLVLETPPPPPPDASIVWLQSSGLETEGCAIDLSRAVRYRPHLPSPAQLRAATPWIARLTDRDIPEDIAHIWAPVKDAVARADLDAARALLQGLGTGLTPTGDDVLAGLVLFARWADPQTSIPSDVASQAVSTDLSRCFLAWAAVGQSIQPVHDLIAAAVKLGSSAASTADLAHAGFDRAVAGVASIGGTSGQGMLAGLGLAAAAWSDAAHSPVRRQAKTTR